jgi:hypothetical protein
MLVFSIVLLVFVGDDEDLSVAQKNVKTEVL